MMSGLESCRKERGFVPGVVAALRVFKAGQRWWGGL